MDIRQLQYFITCAEQRSFSVAAEVLYTSQPHVSAVIQSLEKELGCKLFSRGARGVTLTEAGLKNYEYAVGILKHVGLMQSVNEHNASKNFTILTNSSSNMAVLFSHFFQLHPDYHYRYLEEGVEAVLDKVALHEAQIGFVFVPSNKGAAFRYLLKRKYLHFEPLVQSDMVVYVGKKNPLYGKTSLKPEELGTLKFVQMTDDFFSFGDLMGDELLAGKLQYSAKNVVETNSNHVMVQLLENTDLCNLCSYWLKNRFRYYDFHMIPVEGFEDRITFGYVYHENQELPWIASEFLAYVKAVIKEEI